MGKSSQRKGRNGELELERILRSQGHEVKRHTQWEAWDLTVDGEPIEIKRRKTGYSLFYSLERQGISTVYCRADRKPWLRIKFEVLDDPVHEDESVPGDDERD